MTKIEIKSGVSGPENRNKKTRPGRENQKERMDEFLCMVQRETRGELCIYSYGKKQIDSHMFWKWCSDNAKKMKKALVSSKVIHDWNVHDIAEIHNFQMTRAIIQREVASRNELNQIISLQGLQLEKDASYRARRVGKDFILGDHCTDVDSSKRMKSGPVMSDINMNS